MARQRIAREPMSKLAVWARRCAVFSLTAMVPLIIIVRNGWIEIDPSLAAITGVLGLAALGMLLAIAALVVIWREGIDGVGYSLLALLIGALMLAYPAYLGSKYVRTPALADVTTDASDPPKFDKATSIDGNPRTYAGAVIAARQAAAYPDIETLEVATSVQLAYEAARSVVSKRKWTIINEPRGPQGARREVQIEAIARTPVLGFREDVVVRVRGSADGARIDVRSRSRYGANDLGSNAQRVRSLLEDIEDQVAVMVEERKKAPPKPAAAKPSAPQPAAKR
jgi:uncharacterized protein (DUF1499 family)